VSALAARAGVASGDRRATLTAAIFTAWAAFAALAWWEPQKIAHSKGIAVLLIAAVVARLALARTALPAGQERVVVGCGIVGAALMAAGMVESHAATLAGLVVALAVGAFFRRRPAPLILLTFAIGSTYASLQALFGIYPYHLHDGLLAGLCAAAVMGYLAVDRDRRAVPITGAILLGVYVAVTFVYSQVASVPSIGQHAFQVFGWYMVVLLAIAYGPWDSATHERVAKGILVITGLVAGYAVLRWIIGPAASERALVLIGPGGAYNFSDGKINVFGSFPNTRSLGVWTTSVLPLCVALGFYLRGRWRIAAFVAAGLVFTALLGSALRSGIVAVVVGCLVVLAVMAFTRAAGGIRLGVVLATFAGVGATLAIVLAISAGPSYSNHSYTAIIDPQRDPSYQERLYKWEAAWRDADKHPLGQGLGTAGRTAVVEQRFFAIGNYDVDNSYLKVVLDEGIFGLMLFVAALGALLTGLVRRSLATVDRQRAALGAGGAGALTSFMVVMWTGNYVEGLPAFIAWAIVGLGLAQFATTRRPETF
jgi:hypothetical protein